ncbi:hypothetical protein HG531_003404 [Fusarium graminearum]|nr:hypothetical protein HG531_003404 [Fusarium graminearum]
MALETGKALSGGILQESLLGGINITVLDNHLLKDAEGVVKTVILGDGLVREDDRSDRKAKLSEQRSRRLRSLGGEKALLDNHNSNTGRAKVLLHDNGAFAVRARGQRLGESREFDTIDSLVITVVHEGSVLGKVPGALLRDLAVLAVIDLAGISNNVDMLRTKKSLSLLGSLLRPATSDNVVSLKLLLNSVSEFLLNTRVVLRSLEVGDDLCLLLGHPGANKVVHGSGELSSTTTLHEKNFIVLRNVNVGSKISLGLVDDVGGQL